MAGPSSGSGFFAYPGRIFGLYAAGILGLVALLAVLERVGVPPGAIGYLLVAATLAVLALTWFWLTQPKEWTRGSPVLGRARCTTPCRLRGGVADLLSPREAPHCLCGRARAW